MFSVGYMTRATARDVEIMSISTPTPRSRADRRKHVCARCCLGIPKMHSNKKCEITDLDHCPDDRSENLVPSSSEEAFDRPILSGIAILLFTGNTISLISGNII